MESIIYWAKDSKSFSHLSRVAPLPPISVHGSRVGYSGLVTELQHRPWKVHISFTPEYCGLLCVHLQDFVFVFSIWKLALLSLFNNNGYMYVYVDTELQTSTSLLNFFPALGVIFQVYHTFGGWGQGKGNAMLSHQSSYYILNFHHPCRPSVLWLILIRMSVLFQWFRAV